MTRLLTQAGLTKLQEELEERTVTIRQSIAKAIKEAKEQGDLSENAEYSAAKQQQAENEARVAELEMMIKDAEVVEHDDSDSSVQMGDTVVCKVKSNEITFTIVSSNEAEPAAHKISNESPIGKALIGANAGDVVAVETPAGATKYTIVRVN